MKNLYPLVILFLSLNVNAQNSLPYENTSLVHLKSINPQVEEALHELNATFLACREHQSNSDVIVSETAKNWLSDNNIIFETLVDDLKQKIDQDNAAMDLLRSQRDGEEWYTIYRTYDEVQDKLVEIASSSSIATLIDLGDSYENRAIKGLKFSTGGSDKPAVFFNGCQHAREWITVMATTYFADQLAQEYVNNTFTQTLLDIVDVYIVPIVNPDGYVYTHTTDRYWRKNRQPNSGSSYVGTDLNRNWDADWNGGQSTSTSPSSDIYVGSYPFSATEANVVKNYMESISNLRGHLDIHSYSALVLGPWGYSNSYTPDHTEIVSLGNLMNDAITNTNNYPFTFGVGDANGAIYLASGTMPDWSYDELGALGYTYELRPNSSSGGGFELPEGQILDACAENYNGAMEMIIWAADVQNGCMDTNACNYNADATVDDGSCAEFDECGDCGGNGPNPGYDCDGNCITGETLTIHLNDSYGDGWNGNTITINGVSLTIDNGSFSTEVVCYDANLCVSVVCDGGTWQSEVSWIILNSNGEELAAGGAPYTGEFGNCSGDVLGCTDVLAINYNAEATSDNGSCEYSNTESQVISLPEGWFIFSTYMQPQTPAISDLVSPIVSATIIVKDAEGLAYLPDWGFNGIGDAINGHAYLIKLSESQNLSISGTIIIPEDFVVNLNEGWSLLAYLRNSPANLVTMLAPIDEQIVIVKTFDGTAYLPDWDYNGIGDMNPGEGYQIKVDSDVSFTYPAN
jgi:murein tripeptide amidase MpaA